MPLLKSLGVEDQHVISATITMGVDEPVRVDLQIYAKDDDGQIIVNAMDEIVRERKRYVMVTPKEAGHKTTSQPTKD